MEKKLSTSSQRERQRSKSVVNITDELAAELKALGAMSESEIDTSDIPEKLDWSNAEIGKFFRPVKKLVSMRVDADILHWFQTKGKHYTAMMNQALRSYVTAQEAFATRGRPRLRTAGPVTKKPTRKRPDGYVCLSIVRFK